MAAVCDPLIRRCPPEPVVHALPIRHRGRGFHQDQFATQIVETAQAGVELVRIACHRARRRLPVDVLQPGRRFRTREHGDLPSAQRGQPRRQLRGSHKIERRARRIVAFERARRARRGRIRQFHFGAEDGGDLRRRDLPGRISTARPRERSTIVDSMPTSQSPPSSTASTAAPSSARTCSAVVGLMRPNLLAEGAAMPL